MWYIVPMMQPDGGATGFLVDEDDIPVRFESEDAAREHMDGDSRAPFAEYIEL